jgi:hypothetical protein
MEWYLHVCPDLLDRQLLVVALVEVLLQGHATQTLCRYVHKIIVNKRFLKFDQITVIQMLENPNFVGDDLI